MIISELLDGSEVLKLRSGDFVIVDGERVKLISISATVEYGDRSRGINIPIKRIKVP